jgi:osmoprotectant transport system substrate-binding protein
MAALVVAIRVFDANAKRSGCPGQPAGRARGLKAHRARTKTGADPPIRPIENCSSHEAIEARWCRAKRTPSLRALPAVLPLLLAVAPTLPAVAGPAVVVASKIDTEGALLGSLILAELGDHGIPVRDRLQLGPTNIVRAALLAGQIDIYPEYTGNGALFFHREADSVWKSWAKGFAAVAALDRAQNHLIWLAPAPANNTWVIAVRHDVAERQHLKTMSDFAHYVNSGGLIYLAASAEFVESPSALPAFEKAYGFRLDDRQLLTLSGGNTSATLRAAAEGMSGVNAAMAYGTDGAIAALGLVALTDDKGAQIVYAPAPLVRAAVLRAYPQIPVLLDPVFNSLTLTTLQQLNARIAVDGEDAGAVARGYLRAHRFLP